MAINMPEKVAEDKPCILFMDSLQADNIEEMMQYLREYLELEFLEKKVAPEDKKYFLNETREFYWPRLNSQSVPNYNPNLPKQQNFTDCGLFVLQNTETFLLKPEFVLEDLHQRERVLFHNRVVDSKRDEIMRIIISLAEQTIPVDQFGKLYYDNLLKMQGNKTHFEKKKPE